VVCTGYWFENLKETDHLEDLGTEQEDNIKMDLQVGWGGHGLD
jgi:hypothetical protein